MDEPALIHQAQNQDVQAYNTLVLHYQNLAYAVAYRIMGDAPAAEDATQAAFIAAYKKLHTFKGEHFKAWLMRIVTNKCYDALKYQRRRPQSSLDELVEINESSPFLQGEGGEPEKEQEQAEMFHALQHCLDSLPEDQRLVAILCDVEGYDYQTAAEIVDSSLGTIKSRLSRGRAKLRDCLQGFWELLPDKYRSD